MKPFFIGAVMLCCAGLFACEATTSQSPGLQSDQLQSDQGVPTEAMAKDLEGKINVGIRPVENELIANQSVEVLFYLANKTQEPVEFLPWSTPLEDFLTADLFVVTSNGEPIPYAGPVVKRRAPTPEDYVTVQPNESLESVVNLSQVYDMRSAGEYQIVLEPLYLQNSNGELKSVVADTTVTVTRQ